MKKLVSIVMAVILPIVMLTGCSAPLSESEYKKEVAKLVENYLSIALIDEDVGEEMQDIMEDVGEFDRDALAEIKEIFETEYAKADEYLDKLEKLNPPEEMEGFHDELLGCIEMARDIEEKYIAVWGAKSEDKYESAIEKVGSALEKLMEKIEKYMGKKNWEWLIEELEDSDFLENTLMGRSMMAGVSNAKVTSADMTARGLADTVTWWIADLEANGGTLPSSEYTTIITICGKASKADGGYVWSGSVTTPNYAWSKYNDTDGSVANEILRDYLAENYNFTDDIAAIVLMQGRKVAACAYVDSATVKSDGSCKELDALIETFTIGVFQYRIFDWGGTDGIYKADKSSPLYNKTIGTYPKLYN